MQYIWHCPGDDCKDNGTILFKTNKPFLQDGEIKCQKCKKIYTFQDIEKFNIKNIQFYFSQF